MLQVKYIFYVAIVLAFLAFTGVVYKSISDLATFKVNQKYEESANDFRKNTRKGSADFDTCDKSGGLYNFRTGACELP